jgi:hypothetical protein
MVLKYMTTRIFISYSHRDEAMLDRLHTHLAMLRREGAISEWHDRKIKAGQEIDSAVDRELESSQIFLPLISPDFLASTYCYEREMQRAIERHEADQLKVIPVILEPCDWLASPLSKFKALPKDGKPVTDWNNQNTAWLNVVAELRKAVSPDQFGGIQTPASSARPEDESARSKYRIKRTFDAIDRENFREECFSKIADYFRKSIDEINTIEGLRGRFEQMSSRGFTATILNRNVRGRDGIAHITVRAGSAEHAFGDISYSFQENARENTSNGGFSIESDSYRLFLKLNSFSSGDEKRIWLPEEAASRLWDDFIVQAGISYG